MNRLVGAFCAVFFFSIFATAGSFQIKTLSYNVQGLPWPIKKHRGELPEIGRLLGEMRRQGTQPQVVFLQEAFRGGSIDTLIKNSGYAFVYKGPSTSEWAPLDKKPNCSNSPKSQPCSTGNGKLTNSGTYILSDYKILRAQKAAFGKACTGYDCLSNKGVMMAEIEVPGLPEPIVVLNTHFNSSKSSGSSQAKSDAARTKQLAAVNWFMKKYLPDLNERTVIFGGDFNCWPTRVPYNELQSSLLMQNAQEVCLENSHRCRVLSPESYDTFFGRTPDHIFYKSGRGVELFPVSIEKTFDIMHGKRQISDHLGIETVFEVRSL